MPGWQTLVRFVTQWNQQFDALSEAAGVGTLTTMWTTLSSDLGLSAMTVTSRDMPLVMDVFVASLEILPGSQPLATLVRGLRSFWPQRSPSGTDRPSNASGTSGSSNPVKRTEAPQSSSSDTPDEEQSSNGTNSSPQTNNISVTPPSLPRWFQAFALRSSSLEIAVRVVQRPASHRGKLGGVA